MFGNPVVATALLDRLLHHAVVIHIEGASYCLRQHAELVSQALSRGRRPGAVAICHAVVAGHSNTANQFGRGEGDKRDDRESGHCHQRPFSLRLSNVSNRRPNLQD